MKRISLWGRVIGIVTMITGGLSALVGLFALVIGAIPGIVSVYMGYLIYKTGRSAKEYLENQSSNAIEDLLKSYSTQLLTSGILLIISLIILLLVALLGGIGFFSLMVSMK
jgi:hypothetical protein